MDKHNNIYEYISVKKNWKYFHNFYRREDLYVSETFSI